MSGDGGLKAVVSALRDPFVAGGAAGGLQGADVLHRVGGATGGLPLVVQPFPTRTT